MIEINQRKVEEMRGPQVQPLSRVIAGLDPTLHPPPYPPPLAGEGREGEMDPRVNPSGDAF